MLFRRLTWWSNGRSLDSAIADLDEARETNKARTDKLCGELEKETANLRNALLRFESNVELWEGERMRNVWLKKADVSSPPEVSLNDDLTVWLWHAAFNTCRQTGDWDLLNACAGIASAMRTGGIPLSTGLRATAAPARSGGTSLGSE